MTLYFPQYAAPGRNGRIPPSPPAEARAALRAELTRQSISYLGKMPAVIAPAYYEQDAPRVILPGAPGYWDTLKQFCMPVGVGAYRSNKPHTPTNNTGSGGSFADPSAGWRLEDLRDATPNGNTLTNNGGVTFSAGKINNAANFTGSTSVFLNCASAASLQITTGHHFSVSLWAFMTSSSLNTFIEKGTNTASTLAFVIRNAYGNLRFDVGDGTNSNSFIFATMGTGAWHLLTCWVTASGTYQQSGCVDNGSVSNANLILNSLKTETNNLIIGKRNDGQPVNGAIDSVWFWNDYKLTAGNIATLNTPAEPV